MVREHNENCTLFLEAVETKTEDSFIVSFLKEDLQSLFAIAADSFRRLFENIQR